VPSKTIINAAKKACSKSCCEHTLGAVLYKGGGILRICCNVNKHMSYRRKYFEHGFPTRHAEMNVIHQIPRDVLEKCSVMVIRLNKKGEIKSAKPCIACALSLYHSGVKHVYYSSYSGEILKLDYRELLSGNYQKEYVYNY
jgi:hypothetical protein